MKNAVLLVGVLSILVPLYPAHAQVKPELELPYPHRSTARHLLQHESVVEELGRFKSDRLRDDRLKQIMAQDEFRMNANVSLVLRKYGIELSRKQAIQLRTDILSSQQKANTKVSHALYTRLFVVYERYLGEKERKKVGPWFDFAAAHRRADDTQYLPGTRIPVTGIPERILTQEEIEEKAK